MSGNVGDYSTIQDCRILIKCFSSSWKWHLYGEKHFGYVCFGIAFNISNHLFLHFSKKNVHVSDEFFCVFFPCLGLVQTQLESLIGHAMAEPSHTQWNISFIKAGLLFMFTVVWWVFKNEALANHFQWEIIKGWWEPGFALLLFKAFDKGILGNAVFQNPVLTS